MLSRVVLTALAAALFSQPATAQNYPAKPVHIFVPASPGGASDLAARLVAPKLTEALGQPFVVENRVASGGIVATAQLAKSPADGHTIMMTFDTFASNPHMYKDLPYDVIRDFEPIMLLVRYPQILVVHPSLKVKTVPEFVAYSKANGSRMNFGSAGPASSSRLAFELFKEAAGIEIDPIHYKGGGPAINDLVAGTVQVMLIQAGGSVGQVAPAGTPRPVVEKLNETLINLLAMQEMKDKLTLQGGDIIASTPERFAELIKSETARWGKIIREKNIRID